MGNEPSKKEDFEEGDVLYRDLEQFTIANHYGVFIGDGKVIDFSQEGVQEKSLNEFAKGCEVHVKSYPKSTRKETVSRAKKHLKEGWGGYNLASNNCEHFASFCATGEKSSGQVQKSIAVGVGTVVVGTVAVGVGVAVGVATNKGKPPAISGSNGGNDSAASMGMGAPPGKPPAISGFNGGNDSAASMGMGARPEKPPAKFGDNSGGFSAGPLGYNPSSDIFKQRLSNDFSTPTLGKNDIANLRFNPSSFSNSGYNSGGFSAGPSGYNPSSDIFKQRLSNDFSTPTFGKNDIANLRFNPSSFGKSDFGFP